MKFFDYLYYRMHQAYEARRENPEVRAFQYLSVVFLLPVMVLLCAAEELLRLTLSRSLAELPHHPWWMGILGVGVLLLLHLRFSQKPFAAYEQQFVGHRALNQTVKVWMLVLLPFISLGGSLFLLGLMISR
jgi:hypothetical protein